MDIKIWENTIVAWLNTLTSLPIGSINQINNTVLNEVIKKISLSLESSPVEFLKKVYPNLTENDSFNLSLSVDYLCASTLLLVYISLSKKEELKGVRDLMCTKLDTSAQFNIVEFLNVIQEYENVFTLSYKNFKQEIFPQIFLNFKEKHYGENAIGDSLKTPVKNNSLNSSFDSPLQGFFQTPKRSGNKSVKFIHTLCGDGDHTKRIKILSDQLAEEESEKAALQEKLNFQTHKCNEYELKLKNKLEEIKHLKEEWEKDSKKNEHEINSLHNRLTGKMDDEKKLRSEVSYLETYISKLESDLSVSLSKNEDLEHQLQATFEKISATEIQLRETSELCSRLQSAISEKERDLEHFKETYDAFYNDEKAIDLGYMNGSFNKSVGTPENLGVVVDKLLSEKIEENTQLQKTISQLETEKQQFLEKIKLLNEQMSSHSSVVEELQSSKEELIAKVERFERAEKELSKMQKELLVANSEIVKLNKNNAHLTEKYNILNSKLQEREQVLIGCKNSKMILQVNFLKLAEDLKIIQQRLECEVRNISKLTLCAGNKPPKTEMEFKFADFCEGRTLAGGQNSKSLNDEITRYDSFISDDKFGKLAEVLLNIENRDEWTASKVSLQKTFAQLNDNIVLLNKNIRELEDRQEKSLEEKSKLELHLKEAEERIKKIESSDCFEVKKVQRELEEKENKIKELQKFIQHYKKVQEELLHEKDVLLRASVKGNAQKMALEGGDNKGTQLCDMVTSERAAKMAIQSQEHRQQEHQDFSDSLEEIPVPNKTFEIVNLEDRYISDKTFSIKKDDTVTLSKSVKKDTAWTVSPPSKSAAKVPSKETVNRTQNRRAFGETWVVPFSPKSKEKCAKKISSSVNDLRVKTDIVRISELQSEIKELSKECERLQNCFMESDRQRQKDREIFEKNQDAIRRNITNKYESQLEHLKSEMKQLYNRELAKHKHEQSTLNSELQDQNKRYKEHIDELRSQLWELGEKLLQEQTLNRDLKRNFSELKQKYDFIMFSKDPDLKPTHINDLTHQKEITTDESVRSSLRQIPNGTFTTMPTEDEDEVFDNRFLEDMKLGICKTEKPEDRLKELQYRNSLCLPHLKSSYPGETQFHNPTLYKDNDLKFGILQFAQESQSLTDSDHSMTKSLLPDAKGKKKEQTSYKRPGPPTPSKNGGRLSIHSGDVRLTPRNVLKEINDQNERNKGTPNPLKLLLSSKGVRRGSLGPKDENAAPVTPRKKKFFRKPFGARDH